MALFKTKKGLTTENSHTEDLFRMEKAKEGEKTFEDFLGLFKSELSDKRKENLKSAPIAEKIVATGKFVGDSIDKFEEKTITEIQERGNKVILGLPANPKNVALPNSVLICLSTIVIILESLVNLMYGIFVVVWKAVLCSSGALADLLFIHFREYFSDVNSLQEMSIAVIYFVGYIISTIFNLITHLLGSIQQFVVGYLQVKFGKPASSAGYNTLNIISAFLQFYFLQHFVLRLKILVIATMALAVISFFLKMDDIIRQRSAAFAGVKARAYTGIEPFDYFDYIKEKTGTVSVLLSEEFGKLVSASLPKKTESE